MNKLSTIKFLFFAIVFSFAVTISQAQNIQKPPSQKQGKGLFSIFSGKNKNVRTKGPVSAKASRKKQEANDKKLKKEGAIYVKKNRERSIKIQSPEVQARMKQNVKDSEAKYKAKKKNNSTRTRKAGKKYR
jgi:hypothetical protein